ESMAIYVFGWQQWFAESFEKLTTNLKDARPTLLFGVPRTFEKAYEKIILSVNSSPPFLKNLYKLSTSTGGGISWSAKLAVSAARLFIFRKIRNGFGGRLKWAICGGAPLPKELGEFFHKVGITILEGYGLTETCAPVTLNTPNNIRFGSVGRPLPEVSIKTAPDGEILVKSEKIFKGYFKLPEETTSAFQDGWFCTGDIGSFDKDGFLQITERKKDLIVTSSGKNIAPQKMEGIAKSYVLINQFIVHGDNRNYLTALITLNKEQAIKYATDHQVLFSEYTELVKNPRMIGAMQKIVDDINKHLAKYEKIKRFLILPNEFTVENGELTPSLKFKRSLINKRYKNLLDSMYALSTEY
ncbi:MAG: AMP-binding protein, partial [Candidatus Poribacteria bacterium]